MVQLFPILGSLKSSRCVDVETYEEAVRKQAAFTEHARLKEQAVKEQESKAKSIKDKQRPKDNPNKKSKP